MSCFYDVGHFVTVSALIGISQLFVGKIRIGPLFLRIDDGGTPLHYEVSTSKSVRGTSAFLAASLHVEHTRARIVSSQGRKLNIIATSSVLTSSGVSSARCRSFLPSGDGADADERMTNRLPVIDERSDWSPIVVEFLSDDTVFDMKGG